MTTTKMLGVLGLFVGPALVMTTAGGTGRGQPRHRLPCALSVFDGKEFFGQVVRDGDRFVAIRALIGDKKLGYLRNFDPDLNGLKVDDKYLGYDLRGKDKNVLVRDRSGKDTDWEGGGHEEGWPTHVSRLRAKNGELKGWWFGLGKLEPAKKEVKSREDEYPRKRLILVKDKKDAAGFSWPVILPGDGK